MNDARKAVDETWKILIVDDDDDVHATTQLALRGVSFRGRKLQFIDANSGAEAMNRLLEHPDTAVVFLDVIMETPDAGLNTARSIRQSGCNLARIIIRTGFPGEAPERQVIVDYDIHDYKEKTDLTVQKLFTSVISALRAYDDLVALEQHRRGLLSVLEAVSWFDFNDVRRYVSGMLVEFCHLAHLGSQQVALFHRAHGASGVEPQVLAATGDWPGGDPQQLADLPPSQLALVLDSFNQQKGTTNPAGSTLFMRDHGIELVALADADGFAQGDEVLLEVFLSKVCQAVSNQRTFSHVTRDRDAVLHRLALRADAWNPQATAELQRLAALSTAMAQRLDLTLSFPDEIDDDFKRDIGIAAQLHDLGNQVLPATLLTKPGPLAATERTLMQGHVAAGLSALALFLPEADGLGALARSVIAAHHERYDGSGYPQGLRGDAIPMAARLVAVAEVFVALTSPRPHRPALDDMAACAHILNAAGQAFDPIMVQAFQAVIDAGEW